MNHPLPTKGPTTLRYFLLILLVLLPVFAFSQAPKALFDNTLTETAGNADWIIDTDQPVPSPTQANITGSTSESYWLGGISAWGVALVKLGFTVHTLTATYGITYGNASNPYDLSNYNLFVVCEPQDQMTASEKAAILAFVQNGGGLMMVADHNASDRNSNGWDSPQIWNDMGSGTYFGIHFQSTGETNNSFTQDATNFATSPTDSIIHGAAGTVTGFAYNAGTSMTMQTANNPTAVGHIWMNGASRGTTQVMAATARYGAGKVAAFGDSSPADDGTGQSGNTLYNGWKDPTVTDDIAILNMCLWLVAPSGASAPAQVTLVSPADAATNVASPVTLRWNKPAGSTGYQVDVSTSNTFASMFLSDSTLVDSLRSVNSLALGTTYYWRARAKNASGWGAFSATRSFTAANVPGSVALLLPANAATNVALPALLRWNRAATATGYQVDVSTVNTFVSTVLSDSTLVDSTLSVNGLALNTGYYWRVRAKNGLGWGPYSVTRLFTSWTVPPVPASLAPADAATGVASPVTIRWGSASTATGYHLDVSTSNTFASFVVSDSALVDTARSVGGLLINTTYYWRVRAKSGAGWSAFGATRSFTSWDVPAAVTPEFPSNGADSMLNPVAFRWLTAAGAAAYEIDVSRSSDFTSIVATDSTVTDTVRTFSGLSPDSTYSWRVRAKNGAGWGPYGPTFGFQMLDVPPRATLVSPADLQIDVPIPVPLVWNATPGADRYNIQAGPPNGTGESLYMNDSTLTDTTVAFSHHLLPHDMVLWQVRAHNAAGWGRFSVLRAFTAEDAPAPSVLVSPTDSAVDVPLPVELRWHPAARAAAYILIVATDTPVPVVVHTDSSVVDTFAVVSGLVQNTSYRWSVAGRNGVGVGTAAERRITTWSLPAQAQLAFPSDGATGVSSPVGLRWFAVPGASSYDLEVATDAAFAQSVLRDSALADTSAPVLPPDSTLTYHWRVRAKGVAGWGPFSVGRSFSMFHQATLSAAFTSRWNLVSLPLAVGDRSVSSIFPSAASAAYAFENGYLQHDTLDDGVGYWIKFPAAVVDSLTGDDRLIDTVAVHAGWNLVGMISVPVSAATVETIPPGLLASLFYGYDGSYAVASTLEPFRAYWIKCSADGFVILR